MLFLCQNESRQWREHAARVEAEGSADPGDLSFVRPGLLPAFHYFIGTLLLSKGQTETGGRWIREGIASEPGGLFSNGYLSSYLNRHNGAFEIPEVIFADPAPYVHFAGTPVLQDSRMKFRNHCVQALPKIQEPLRIMDIGCGHGMVLVDLLLKLRVAGIADAVEEILLVDPSEGMLKLARENVAREFPEAKILLSHARIEALSEHLTGHYHIALASLAYHHMPYETKLFHLKKMSGHIDTFVLFELEANNDTPEMHSPELALSVYQSYGGLIDFIFANDAPVELAVSSIDRFLMSEAIYFFIEPRGKRTDYHMLRSQWHQVFREGLGEGFSCLADSTCYADENIGLFTMIYGKG